MLFLGISLKAQFNYSAADSLRKLITPDLADDSVKVKHLINYSRSIYFKMPDTALIIFNQALNISQKTQYKQGVIRAYNGIASCYWFKNNPDLTISNFKLAINVADEEKNFDLISLVTNNLGTYYQLIGISDSAEKYFKISLEAAVKLSSKERYINTISDLSMLYFDKGNYPDAINYILEAKDYYESHNKHNEILSCFIQLGMIYYDLNDFKKSISFYRQGLKEIKGMDDIQYELIIRQNMGMLYSDLRADYDSARILLTETLQLARTHKAEDICLSALVNLGNIAHSQKSFRLALDYYNEAYLSPLIPTRNHERSGILVNLGSAWMNLGDLKKAETYALEGLKLAEDNNFITFEKAGCKTMGDIQAKKGNYKAAFDYYLRYSTLQDTLANAEVKQRVSETIFQNSLKQKENENLLLQKDNEIHQQTIYIQRFYIITSGLIVLSGIILLITFIRNSRKQRSLIEILDKKNAELHELNLSKDKIFSIIAHDLRIPFNGYLGLTRLMAEEIESLSKEEIQKIAISMHSSSTYMFRLLEDLLDFSLIHQGLKSFDKENANILQLMNEGIGTFLDTAQLKGIELTLNIPSELNIFTNIYMFRAITRNAISNALKFTPKDGKVEVAARKEKDGNIEISIHDTGIGMSDKMMTELFSLGTNTGRKGTEGEPGTGLGLIICKEFIEKQGGRFRIESKEGAGTTVFFTFPSE